MSEEIEIMDGPNQGERYLISHKLYSITLVVPPVPTPSLNLFVPIVEDQKLVVYVRCIEKTAEGRTCYKLR